MSWTRAPTCEHPNLSGKRKTHGGHSDYALIAPPYLVHALVHASPCRVHHLELDGFDLENTEQMLLVVIHCDPSLLYGVRSSPRHACISTVNGYNSVRHPSAPDRRVTGTMLRMRLPLARASGTPLSQQYSISPARFPQFQLSPQSPPGCMEVGVQSQKSQTSDHPKRRQRAHAPCLVWGHVRCVYSEREVTVP
jgi:hypothetical protein